MGWNVTQLLDGTGTTRITESPHKSGVGESFLTRKKGANSSESKKKIEEKKRLL